MQGVSVIVCCYNSAQRLPKTIEHLAKQIVPNNINWEVIVINNNSSDNTAEVALNEWKKFNVAIPFQIINQPIPGLSAARETGFDTAKYEFVLMCDDDNWLSNDYVKIVYNIMSIDDKIGALGGVGTEECETSPPTWFENYKPTFAVGKFSTINGDITHTTNGLYGAGAVVRKSAYFLLKQNSFVLLTTDRIGGKMSSGGDTELFWALELIGYKIWFDDSLKFTHFISSKNMLPEIFMQKMYNGTQSEMMLSAYMYIRKREIFKNRPNYKKHWTWLLMAHLLPFLLSSQILQLITFLIFKIVNDNTVKAKVQLAKIVYYLTERGKDKKRIQNLSKAAWLKVNINNKEI